MPLEALNTYDAYVYVVKKESGGPTRRKRLRVGNIVVVPAVVLMVLKTLQIYLTPSQ